ncbi:MAG: dTDP-4-dehydrorhamnose reductase [Desulfuromonadales bacterium GWC2_61_20]|nr:MAG: dTDP-4-dehydrorhamnose reductase [Desulfuromonadales bacterium GWC2_61_20]
MKLALIGSNGMLARKVRELAPVGSELHGFDLPEFDLTDRAQVLAAMARLKPTVIINCAAFTNVDGCETQEDLATRVNGAGPGYLAEAAQAVGAVLVHISTDYVFAGDQTSPYREDDPTTPLSAYGRSKLAGEKAIVASGLARYFIVRTSWLYGPGGKNFVETMLRLAVERDELRVVADQFGSPTYTGDLAAAIFRLLALSSPAYGIYHLADLGECSWHGFAEAIVELARLHGEPVKALRVLPIATSDYPLPAPRPAYSVFNKEKYLAATGAALPHWRDSLDSYFRERSQLKKGV